MNSLFFTSLLTMALFATQGVAQFIIHTPPSATTCSPLRVTWTGGSAPYHLRILPGQQPNSTVLRDLGEHNGLSTTWTVNVNSGTSVVLNLQDNSRNVAWSGAFTVNAGADTSCVDSSGGSGTSTGSSSASSTPTTTGVAPSGATNSATVSGTGVNTASTVLSSAAGSTDTTGTPVSAPPSTATNNTPTILNPSAPTSATGNGTASAPAPATTSQSSAYGVGVNSGLVIIAAMFSFFG